MSTKELTKMNTSGKWESGLKTSISIRDFAPVIVDEPANLGGTDEGPNPLEYVLAGLSSCTSVMIALIAKEQNFTFEAVSFENEGSIDLEGLMGVEGVSTYFQTVKYTVYIETSETDEKLSALKAAVEKRCPVLNILINAGVNVEANWIKQ